MEKVEFTLQTDGSGYWSNVRRAVKIVGLSLAYRDDEDQFGELRVHFDVKDWNVDQLGLIYTDNLFISELEQALAQLGLAGADVDYSEQGMQGDDYVSCDVGAEFIDSWDRLYETA